MEDKQKILLTEITKEGILRIVMNDPNSKNALSEIMMNSLIEKIHEASLDNSIRVIVLAANGNVFSSGHDLKEITAARSMEEGGEDYFSSLFELCSSLMQLIINSPRPIIAEVSGVATAAGCQLVSSCDLAISSESSKFATPGVNLGLFCSTPMVALSRVVKNKHAMEMLLTGDFIDANKAKEIGLINNYFNEKDLTDKVMELANKIASKSTMTVSMGKKAFYAQKELDLSKAYELTSRVMVENLLKDDAVEGINAFFEKRPPEWKN